MSLPGNLRLPFDILLELIHSLDPNHDNGTLRSLSATCHTLCAPSQSRLFSSITIRENTRTHEHVFHGHILKSPHLASYIRYLDYRCIYVNYHWVAKILDLLPVNNIEVLKISTENRNGYEYIGYELPDALVRIVQSPRLRQLQLHGLTSIPWFATNAPNLTDLLLDISSFQLPGQDAQTGILGVKSLTMTGRSLERSSQLKLALRCSPLLRNLRFYALPGDAFTNLATAIIEGNLSYLSTLEIFVRMKPYWSTNALRCLVPLSELHSELDILSTKASSTPSRTTRLRHLHIVLSELRPPHLTASLFDIFTDMDEVISRPEFRHLEEISITVAISSEDSDEAPAVLRTRGELEQIEDDICAAFAGTVATHGIRLCCDALNLVVVHDECDFWEIKKNEDGTTAESVCVW